MNHPIFQLNSKVRVISKNFVENFTDKNGVEHETNMYGWNGVVVQISGFDKDANFIEEPYTSENYPEKWIVDVRFISPVDGVEWIQPFYNWETEIESI